MVPPSLLGLLSLPHRRTDLSSEAVKRMDLQEVKEKEEEGTVRSHRSISDLSSRKWRKVSGSRWAQL